MTDTNQFVWAVKKICQVLNKLGRLCAQMLMILRVLKPGQTSRSPHFKKYLRMITTNVSANLTLGSTGGSVPESQCFEDDPLVTKVARILAYSIVMIAAVVGNLMVIVVVWKGRRMRTTVNFFIVNMAAADLVISLYMLRMITILFAGYEWHVDGVAGAILCKISILFNQTPMIVSVLTVVAISFERFNAVLYPLKTIMSARSCKVVIALTWLIALAIRLPTVFAVRTIYHAGKLYCYLYLDETYGEGTKILFYQFTFIGLFFVPFVAILVLYSAIIFTLQRRKAFGSQGDSVSSHERLQRRRVATNKKVLRMIASVVIAFWICWLLYYIVLIGFSYGMKISCNLLFLRLFLAHFNSALNPWLYAKFSENYRRGFKNIMGGLFGLCKCSLHVRKPSRERELGQSGSDGSVCIKIAGELQEMNELETH